ncbi:hypothetical protein B0H13DRAFT_2656030 [Mycena leptocephala]|nr:hypothetical protein B0H13DRAFT_2656030 [Mycena leptocephala]
MQSQLLNQSSLRAIENALPYAGAPTSGAALEGLDPISDAACIIAAHSVIRPPSTVLDKMQFSLVALFAIAATVVSAGPLRLRRNTCDLKNCALDLAPTVLGCGSAAAQLGADPFSDAGCVVAALKDAVDLPASCNGCADQLGISSAVDEAKNGIEDLF